MAEIILDLSANTHKNDKKIIKKVIDEVRKVDTGRHDIVFKGQLFKSAGDNIPCSLDIFDYFYKYARDNGYKATSSVFDSESLEFLLKYDIPFVKIACDKKYDFINCFDKYRPYWIYQSVFDYTSWNTYTKLIQFFCVPEYPAKIYDYTYQMGDHDKRAFSDHSIGTFLFRNYLPQLWEKHIKLPDSTGLDAGPWAITPEELKVVL